MHVTRETLERAGCVAFNGKCFDVLGQHIGTYFPIDGWHFHRMKNEFSGVTWVFGGLKFKPRTRVKANTQER